MSEVTKARYWLLAVLIAALLVLGILGYGIAMANDSGWISCIGVTSDGRVVSDIENGEIAAEYDGETVTFTYADGTVASYPMARVGVTACTDGQVFIEDVHQEEIGTTTTIVADEVTDTTFAVEILTPLVLVAEPPALNRYTHILRF